MLRLGIFICCCCLFAAECQAAEIVKTDLLIVGATESGWAAGIQAARNGVESIVIVHDGDWYGGQYTEQALACVDENKGVGKVGWGVDWHPMKRSFHRSGLFRELMDRIEAFNTETYGSPMPGKPHHGPSTFRPAEAEAIFRLMIQPYIDAGQIRVIWRHCPHSAKREGERLTSVSFVPVDSTGVEASTEVDLIVQAKLTIDASDWGEVIQVSGTEYECGPDPQSRYGEPSAPADATQNPPNEMNPITWAMIVAESAGETPIPQPAGFDDRNYPRATPFSNQAFRDLNWDVKNPGLGSILHWPKGKAASSRQLSVFTVRRIVDGYTSKDGKTSILLNYMNGQDYPLERLPADVIEKLEATESGASQKNIVEMTRAQRRIIFEDAKQHSLGVLYHLQNFVHDRAEDHSNSFRHFHLSKEFGTSDDLPPKPYIRESLRLKAMYMMREQDGRNRDGITKTKAKERFAHVMYSDGLFAWQFHYDFHRTGRTYLTEEGNNGPWIDYHKTNRHTKFMSDRSLFPLRSLIPIQTDGLIGAQGNVGFSSIVSAAIRLHDQRIHIGQAAGAVAAICLRKEIQPREIVGNRHLTEAVRHCLCGEGDDAVPLLLWPFRDLDPSQPSFIAINRLAALGVLPQSAREVDFQPDELASAEFIQSLIEGSRFSKSVQRVLIQHHLREAKTRGQVCQTVWKLLQHEEFDEFAWKRLSETDADGDGIDDADDALPFTANDPIVFEIEKPVLTADTDGVPSASDDSVLINFCGSSDVLKEVSLSDHGTLLNQSGKYGWSRDLTSNHRRRHHLDGPRDSFIFTRETDQWSYRMSAGRYRVTVCVGDSGHEQLNQQVTIQGQPLVDNVTTAEGQFHEATIELDLDDEMLKIQIGSGKSKSNTCLNWVMIEALE